MCSIFCASQKKMACPFYYTTLCLEKEFSLVPVLLLDDAEEDESDGAGLFVLLFGPRMPDGVMR